MRPGHGDDVVFISVAVGHYTKPSQTGLGETADRERGSMGHHTNRFVFIIYPPIPLPDPELDLVRTTGDTMDLVREKVLTLGGLCRLHGLRLPGRVGEGAPKVDWRLYPGFAVCDGEGGFGRSHVLSGKVQGF